MSAEASQWDHGAHKINGKSVFDIGEGAVASRLHLVSFSEAVEEEQIRDLVNKRQLRGLTEDEWNAFVATTPRQAFAELDFSIALMFTAQRDDTEAHLLATVVYNPRKNMIEIISNWIKRSWSCDFAFMFSEKIVPKIPPPH